MKNALPINGVFLLDKPVGISSSQALGRVKYFLNASKGGHTGTLDPLATGLLPLCFGEATKFSQGLFDADKTYEADICLGKQTTTGDAEGEVIATLPVICQLAQIDTVLKAFTGEITQIPPMYSALKKDGKPLYVYARAGQEVKREPRKVMIYQLTQLHFSSPILKVRVVCSKGTYIRTLAEDIGQALGCGAHLVALRRTAIADLNVSQAITLQDMALLNAEQRMQRLAPLDILIHHCHKIDLPDTLATRFLQGQRLLLKENIPEGLLRVYQGDQLLGLAHFENSVLKPQRLIRQVT